MIQDFTNPHGEIKPKEVIKSPIMDFTNQIRVIREQGLYFVQVLMSGRGVVVNESKYWHTIIDKRTDKPNQFQTIQEAENLIKRIQMPYEEYYY